MNKNKQPQIPKKNEVSLVRSSAAEYLTFVAATGGRQTSVEMRYEDENLWLTQKMMATLYDVSVPAISQHLKRIYADNELEREATVKQYLMVQTEGEREVQRKVDHYSLQAIIAVGFKIENERAVQFRKWANQIVKDYTIQGWVMDVERLKSGGSVLTEDFFERQLEKIREIRLSERKFYQKITDIYATALDYDTSATATKRFFAAVQNKLHFAIHGQTAAEVIVDRADHRQENMGLTSWEGAPHGKIHKYDVSIAKNYLVGVRDGTDAADCVGLSGHGRTAGHAPHPHDHAGLGRALGRLPETLGSGHSAGRRQGVGRNRQGARRKRVREIPHRAGSLV